MITDLQLSIVYGHDKQVVACTVEFDQPDDALAFNEKLVDLVKTAMDGNPPPTDQTLDVATQGQGSEG